MGWLERLFGQQRPQANRNQANQTQSSSQPGRASAPAATTSNQRNETIPPERVGLNGEYDQSGLAKRVALAFDDDSTLSDIETLYVAQTGSTVVLKGKVPNQQILDTMVSIARRVNGSTAVDTTQVTIG